MDIDQPMTKLRFLEQLLAERERWDALLIEVGERRMTEAMEPGGWSVKDVVAHIAWSEREMVGVMRERALVGSDLWNLEQDERNRIVYEENRDRPLDEVLAEARDVYRDFLECVKHLADDDLHDPGRYLGMPPDWTPWRVLAGCCYHHYADHHTEVRAWLDGQTGDE
ncbi:MAG: DinB family protein [Thermomicrobiales bacterium]